MIDRDGTAPPACELAEASAPFLGPASAEGSSIDLGPDREEPAAAAEMAPPAEVDPVRLVEAYLFAAPEPVEEREIQALLGARAEARTVLADLERSLAGRGVRLERQGRAWALRTAPDLAPFLSRVQRPVRRLSKAAMETLAVIAWQQPATRAEIEAVRGVSLSAGTLELLVELGWIAPQGRREAPGRPVTWVTTRAFLDAFGLSSLQDLPRLDELAQGGLFKASVGH